MYLHEAACCVIDHNCLYDIEKTLGDPLLHALQNICNNAGILAQNALFWQLII